MIRLEPQQCALLKKSILSLLPDAAVYLFGSQVDPMRKGGDIDILVLAERRLTWVEVAQIRFEFESHFGEQKLDIVSMRVQDEDPFKTSILDKAVLL